MSLTIYGTPAARTFRVLWAAHELGLAYENIPYAFTGPEIKAAPYLAINPNGAIPAIVDEGGALWESLAINLYLARKSGKLWPDTLHGEGVAFQWTLFAATELEPLIGTWFYNAHFLPPEKRDAKAAADAAARLPNKLAVLDGVLAATPWLAGREFGIADLNVAAILYRAPAFGLDGYPHLKGWHARCYARPAAKAMVALREKAMA